MAAALLLWPEAVASGGRRGLPWLPSPRLLEGEPGSPLSQELRTGERWPLPIAAEFVGLRVSVRVSDVSVVLLRGDVCPGGLGEPFWAVGQESALRGPGRTAWWLLLFSSFAKWARRRALLSVPVAVSSGGAWTARRPGSRNGAVPRGRGRCASSVCESTGVCAHPALGRLRWWGSAKGTGKEKMWWR